MLKPALALLFFSLLLTSCDWGGGTEPIQGQSSAYSPVLMKRSELENSVKTDSSRTIKKPGKMYTYGNYIFISERFEGIHLIDNSDPTNPVNVLFINIPGCVDMAVKNNVLYADNAVDLVSLSLEDLNNIKEISRNRDVFPELFPPDFNSLPIEYSAANRPENTIIIGWK